MFLTLTKAQAEAVRGISEPGHALEPVEAADGTFILNELVLTDPHHNVKKALLEGRTKVATFTAKVAADDDVKVVAAGTK